MTLTLDKDNPLATKVQTRDGRKARLVAHNLRGAYWLAAVVDCGQTDAFVLASKDGRVIGTQDFPADIVNEPVEHRLKLHIYRRRAGDLCVFLTDGVLFDEPTARIACVEVVFREGDGL